MLVLCTILIVSSSCKKEPEKVTCIGGSGGSVTIVAYPKHHGKAVRPYTASVKFNTKESPGTANYDMTKTADTTEDHIELTGLKCGDYYIYVTGYDTSIKEKVKGGIPYTLSESASGEVAVDIPITE